MNWLKSYINYFVLNVVKVFYIKLLLLMFLFHCRFKLKIELKLLFCPLFLSHTRPNKCLLAYLNRKQIEMNSTEASVYQKRRREGRRWRKVNSQFCRRKTREKKLSDETVNFSMFIKVKEWAGKKFWINFT